MLAVRKAAVGQRDEAVLHSAAAGERSHCMKRSEVISRKLLLRGLLALLLLAAPVSAMAAAGNGDTHPGASEGQALQVEENTIDRAGENLGEGIEHLGNRASSHLGAWVMSEAFFGISWLKLLFCAALAFGVILAERLLHAIIAAKIKAIPAREGVISWLRMLLQATLRPLTLLIWVYGVYAALTPLFPHFASANGTNLAHAVAQKAVSVVGTVAVFWFFYNIVRLLDERLARWAATTDSTIDDILAPLVGKTLRVFIVIIGALIVLKNLTGLEIGPLLASLGIGGLAVALAAKDSIANFFGTLTILFDKPFQVGERIVIDNYDGVVESVGFRSSRIRTLTGHMVTIPNEKLINSVVENIGKRPHIRWLANIGITYDTPPEKVARAVAVLEEILAGHEGLDPEFPPRVFFNGFNDWSLNIMVVLWYHPADYWNYAAFLQRTCLEILRRFRQEGIDFAFPSQTVYAANDDKRQLKLWLMNAAAGDADEFPA
jgi:MscS family membrane protein